MSIGTTYAAFDGDNDRWAYAYMRGWKVNDLRHRFGVWTGGARELPGIKKGIRIGSAKDGSVTEDMESTAPDHSGAEGVGVDAQGNVHGGSSAGGCWNDT